MKKYIIFSAIVLLGAGCGVNKDSDKTSTTTPVPSIPQVKNISYTRPSSPISNLPITQSATCYFQRFSSVQFENEDDPFASDDMKKIVYKSDENSSPLIIAFVDLDTPNPKLTSNGGQGELVKVIDDDTMVSMIEKGPLQNGANIIVYTIYKNEGVATFTKQYKLLLTPYAHVAMGYCQ